MINCSYNKLCKIFIYQILLIHIYYIVIIEDLQQQNTWKIQINVLYLQNLIAAGHKKVQTAALFKRIYNKF